MYVTTRQVKDWRRETLGTYYDFSSMQIVGRGDNTYLFIRFTDLLPTFATFCYPQNMGTLLVGTLRNSQTLRDYHQSLCWVYIHSLVLQLTFTAKALEEMHGMKDGREVGVSYLPLSHIAAQVRMCTCYCNNSYILFSIKYPQ